MAKTGPKPGTGYLPSHPFKPGNPGGPGRPVIPEVLKRVNLLTQIQVAEVGTTVLERNIKELQQIISDPNSTGLQVMTASVAAKIISTGDADAYNRFLDRIIGKSVERIRFEGEMPHESVQGLSDAELDKTIEALARKALEPACP